MFSNKSFTTFKGVKYPRFNRVIQSWYSPLINRGNDDAGYSACVTLATTLDNKIMICSVVNGKISTVVKLKKHIECMLNDYLNKSDELKISNRTPQTVVFESKPDFVNPSLQEIYDIPAIEIALFMPEYNGGVLLDERVGAILHHTSRIRLMSHPLEKRLRDDDAELVGILSAYPSPEAYALTSAFVQGVLYFLSIGAFDPPRRERWKEKEHY